MLPVQNRKILLVAVCILTSLRPMTAGLVDPVFANSFQPLQTPLNHMQAPDPPGAMYFDNFSWKAPNANAAYFVLGTGFFADQANSPRQPLPFLGNPDGTALPSFDFDSSVPVIADLLYAGAMWAPFNSLGWYDLDSPAFGFIFQANGSTPRLGSVTFSPPAHFGLFFVPNNLVFNPQQSYFTDESKNGLAQTDVQYAQQNGITLGPENFQHFAVFEESPDSLIIAIEDRSRQVGDGDYTDMVLSLTQVPEPSTAPPIVSALVVLLYALRPLRERQQRHR
jgi:hypothetical protein